MDKRNKFWRRQQMARVFKARMVLYAAYGHCIIREDGSYYEHPHWFELAKDKWAQVYKTTGTPCSCWMCRGFECVEDLNMIARSIRKKLCGLFGNQWSSLMRTESIHE